MEGTTFGLNPNPLFENRPGPGLEPVGGEFQPRLETVYPGGGAYLIFVIEYQCLLKNIDEMTSRPPYLQISDSFKRLGRGYRL